MTMRVTIPVPEPVFRYLERAAKMRITSVSSEARTCLVRGALLEWMGEEIAMGASLNALSQATKLPSEVIIEAFEPVLGEDGPLSLDRFMPP